MTTKSKAKIRTLLTKSLRTALAVLAIPFSCSRESMKLTGL